jgi:hypothetical protein
MWFRPYSVTLIHKKNPDRLASLVPGPFYEMRNGGGRKFVPAPRLNIAVLRIFPRFKMLMPLISPNTTPGVQQRNRLFAKCFNRAFVAPMPRPSDEST